MRKDIKFLEVDLEHYDEDVLMRNMLITHEQNIRRKTRANEPDTKERYPAWELERHSDRKVTRGSEGSPSIGWNDRWMIAEGPVLKCGRLIALIDDPVWPKLGDSSIFDDALDVDVPPFAINSGMGWRMVCREEALDIGLNVPVIMRSPLTESEALERKKLEDDPVRAALLAKILAERAIKPGYIRLREAQAKELEAVRKAYLGESET